MSEYLGYEEYHYWECRICGKHTISEADMIKHKKIERYLMGAEPNQAKTQRRIKVAFRDRPAKYIWLHARKSKDALKLQGALQSLLSYSSEHQPPKRTRRFSGAELADIYSDKKPIIVFNQADFVKAIKTAPLNAWFIWDEVGGKYDRSGKTKAADEIIKVFKSIQARRRKEAKYLKARKPLKGIRTQGA
jgi:hypothetical protein